MKQFKKSILSMHNQDGQIVAESRELLAKSGFKEDDIAYYLERLAGVLDDYAAEFGEGTEVEYVLGKRLGRVEAKILIPGKAYDPFENGSGSKRRKMERILSLNMLSQTSCIGYAYMGNKNVVSAKVPLEKKRRSLLKDPTIWAVVLGILVGCICLHVPKEVNAFVMDDLLDPIMSVILKAMAGVMGPVLFLSMLSAIISLDSINELTNMGFKIFRRFVRIILFVTVLSIGVSLLFISNFVLGNTDFSPNQIITMLLNIIPTNLVAPFLENNTPQLVILAFLVGVAMLILGDRTAKLCDIIHQLNDCTMQVMSLVLKITPVIPFLSLATAIGKGNAGILKDGWKFIAASYIVFTVCFVFKLVKTTFKTRIPASELMRKVKPILLTGFSTASMDAPLKQIYETSKKEFHIKPEFSSFWIPMSSAMLALQTTVNVILATVLMTEMIGMPLSITFFFVLMFLTLEMSLASPGTTASWVIAFEAFSMPTSYVGLFSTYRCLTINYSVAAVLAYNMFEQVEVANKMGAIE